MAKKQKRRKKKNKSNKVSLLPQGHGDIPLNKSVLDLIKNYPVFDCLINAEWRNSGMVQAWLARQTPYAIIVASFAVDIYCLGVKNAFIASFKHPANYQNFRDVVIEKYSPDIILKPCELSLLSGIIYGAVNYAHNLGFEPHTDFRFAKHALGKPLDPPKAYRVWQKWKTFLHCWAI